MQQGTLRASRCRTAEYVGHHHLRNRVLDQRIEDGQHLWEEEHRGLALSLESQVVGYRMIGRVVLGVEHCMVYLGDDHYQEVDRMRYLRYCRSNATWRRKKWKIGQTRNSL